MRSCEMGFEVQICVILTIVITVLGGPREQKASTSPEVTQEFGASITNFSIDVFKSMVNSSLNRTTSPQNVIYSPSSAFRALLLLSFSAKENSKLQLEKGLHIEGIPNLGSKYKQWKNSKSKEVMEGDRLYRDKSVTIQDAFINLIGGDDIEEVEMSDPGTVGKVNEWVSQITNGQISQFLDEIDPDTKLLLLSAIYMKAEWASPFNKEDVRQEIFTLYDNSTVTVPTMRKEENLKYYEGESYGCDVVSLDYKDSDLKFVIFLPYAGKTVADLVSSMSREMIETVMTELKSVKVTLTLPKFKVEKAVDFVPLCKALGITDIFDPRKADLSAFHSDEPLYIKEVLQKVVLEVDEEGTTAAAATKADMYARNAGIQFYLNIPFVYMIYDLSSGTPLFLGTMMNPKE